MIVEVENLAHLEKIIKATRKVKGITDVARREHITTAEAVIPPEKCEVQTLGSHGVPQAFGRQFG